jgi:hypothetical protein
MMVASKSIKILLVALISALALGGLVIVPSVSAATPSNSEESIDICPGVDEAKIDQVDILILLDNSLSLSTGPTTDKDGQRFEALKTMFESVWSGVQTEGENRSRVNVDISLMAFAQTTKFGISNQDTGIVPLESTISDPEGLANEIKSKLPNDKQQGGTNFINALNDARDFLDSKPDTSCKFLIWFTDGVFDYDDSQLRDNKTEADYLAELTKGTCDKKGWPQELRDSHVNTYVVLLGDPAELKKKKENFQETLDLMAQITGDRTIPGELGEVQRCSGDLPSVVGEIFSVDKDEIGKLKPVFQRIGVAITGPGGDIYCPTPSDPSLVTPALPDSKFIKTISLISLDLQPLPKLEDIQVITSVGETKQIGDFFVEKDLSSTTKTSFSPSEIGGLAKGWKISLLANLKGYCLMATYIDPLTVRITKSGNNPAELIQPGGLLTADELSQVVFKYKGEDESEASTVSADDIMSQEITAEYKNGLTAELDIEAIPSIPVFGSKFPINLEIDKPMPDFGSCISPWVFESDRNPKTGDTPSNRSFKTPECRVSTLGLAEGNTLGISIAALVSELEKSDGCSPIKPSLLIDGKSVGSTYLLPVGLEAMVSLEFEVGSKSTACALNAFKGVGFTYGNPSTEEFALVTSAFSFKQPPPFWWVRIVTASLVLIAMLLSLLLLRLISSSLAVMPSSEGIYSYEAMIEIGLSQFGQVNVSIGAVDLNVFQPSASDLKRPLGSSSKSALVLQKIRIDRKLGAFFKPFSETKAEVAKSTLATYWQRTDSGGLAVPFRKAIIVSKPESIVPVSEQIVAQLTIIVPTSGSEGGLAGVINLLRGQKIKEVCKEFRDKSSAGSSESSIGRQDVKQTTIASTPSKAKEIDSRPLPPTGPSRRPGPPPIPGS